MYGRLVLASASPRRRELMNLLEVPFDVVPSRADEPPYDGSVSPSEYALRLARAKAEEVAARHDGGAVLGCDTIVTLDGTVFGKPVDVEDAARMLLALAGRTHEVITGVCLMRTDTEERQEAAVSSLVTFRRLDQAMVARYIASGEPMDKAGAYAIQGRAATYVTRIEGCYFNIVGLPVPTIATMLSAWGWPVL